MNIIRSIYSSAIGFIDHCLKYKPSKAKPVSSKSSLKKIRLTALQRSKRNTKRKVRHHYFSQSESSLDQSSRYFEISIKNSKRKKITKNAGKPKKQIKIPQNDSYSQSQDRMMTSSIYRFEDDDGLSISSISPKSEPPEFLNQSLIKQLAPLLQLESPQQIQQNRQQQNPPIISSDSSRGRERIPQEPQKPNHENYPQFARNLPKQRYPVGRLILKRKNSIDSSSSYQYILEEYPYDPKA